MAPASVAERPWYRLTFDRTWLRAYAHRNDEEAARNAPSLVRWLGVGANQRVLDVGCGAGRYARALASRGIRVTGVDLSPAMISEARERSPNLPGTPSYVVGDARRLAFREQFEGAISMFTSFGYFDAPGDDLAILRGVQRALVPGGRLVIDFLNERHLRATFVERGERESSGMLVREERRIEEDGPGGPCVHKRVTLVNPKTGNAETSFAERVRLYTAEEIDAMLLAVGLAPVGYRMGDVDGTPFSWGAPRLVRIAARVARGA